MKQFTHMDIPVELERLRPLYDFVLVKRLPDEESAVTAGGIVLPESARSADRPGLRRGLVVLIGAGDAVFCERCWTRGSYTSGPLGVVTCEDCRGAGKKRHPMNVEPGDVVVYQRAPANDIRLNGEEYVFLHEQQHVLAVLEAA